ncbi:MAG: pyridoxal phosphate-dependent aminotransferase [candidate division NC10 bacterium]|nr:pyridoxal phosphate-dependent aminotransferase [candidate division NC10 bacterium]
MFSSRLPQTPAPNALSGALARLRERGIPYADLTESNPTRAGLAYPPDLLRSLADARSLVYEPAPLGLPAARHAVADDFRRRGVTIDPQRIVLTASTSEAYALLFKLLCDPGDRVLVPVPSYPLFEYLTRLEGVEADTYPLEYDGAWEIDLEALKRVITPRTRAVLVVSPSNPTGACLTRRELSRLAALCAEESLALIGDEVFADYPLRPRAEAAKSVLAQNLALTFSLGGLSKSAGLPQVKLGWIGVGGPPALVEPALEALELISDTYLSVSTPVQQAAAELLAWGGRIRGQIAARTRASLDQLRSAVARHPACRLLEPEAGWYAVLQVPGTRSEERIVLDLLERERVLVHPGYFFDFPREAFLVVSLLPPAEVFEDAVERMLPRLE